MTIQTTQLYGLEGLLDQLKHRDPILGNAIAHISDEHQRGMALIGILGYLSYQDGLLASKKEQDAATKALEERAYVDGLTGLGNKLAFLEQAYESYQTGHAGVMLMVDLDHFKSINDTYSHEAGDAVLVAVGKKIRQVRNAYDFPSSRVRGYRWGGEEFALTAEHLSLEQGKEMAEKIREGIAELQIPYGDAILTVTASVGVASLSEIPGPVWADRAVDLFALADHRAYRAKNEGRNKVVYQGRPDR